MELRRVLTVIALLVAACGGETGTTTTAETADTTVPPAPDSTTTAVPTTTSATAASPSTPVWFGDHISVGACFDDAYDEDGEWYFTDVPLLAECSAVHDNEAYHVFTLGDENGPFPGDDAFDDHAAEVCRSELAGYLGADPEPGGIDWWWGWPLAEQWEEGARHAFCAAYLPDAHLLGSLRGIGTAYRPAELPLVAPVPEGSVYRDLSFSEDGNQVASFLMPSATLEEAIEVALAASTAAGLTPHGTGRSGSVFVFRFDVDGVTYPVTVYERSDGRVEWWIYFPPE